VEKEPILPTLTKSLIESKTMFPPNVELNVGPSVNVPVFALPLKSVHVVPLPPYEFLFPASQCHTNPSVDICFITSPFRPIEVLYNLFPLKSIPMLLHYINF